MRTVWLGGIFGGKKPGGDASSTEAGHRVGSQILHRVRDRDTPSATAYRRLVDSKIDAAPPPIAAPISAPFLPPTMAPTPAPDAADPPMIIAVFFQLRWSGTISRSTFSRCATAGAAETAGRAAVRRSAAGCTAGRALTTGAGLEANCEACAY